VSQTVERAVAIIEQLSDRPTSLGEVADRLGVHKSTALRLLQTLERAGFARRGVDGRYAVGTRLIGIAHKALDSFDLREIARPHLTRLNESCGHTLHLASRIDDEIVYIDKYEGRTSVRMYSRIGKTASPHASGVGKAILAHLEPAQLDRVLGTIELVRYTAQTITGEERLRADLAAVRECGYARDNAEFEDVINCVAAPIRSSDGQVRSAISISAPKALASLAELELLVPDLTATAAAISRDYGWPGTSGR
jgi:DNA-binding IclR family transcriptional regulator